MILGHGKNIWFQEHTNTCKVVPSYSSDAEERSPPEGTAVLLVEWFLTFRTTAMPSSSQSSRTRRIIHGLQNLKMKAVRSFEKSLTAYLLTQHCNTENFSLLNAELNPICHLVALLAHPIVHISRIRVNSHKNTCVFNMLLPDYELMSL